MLNFTLLYSQNENVYKFGALNLKVSFNIISKTNFHLFVRCIYQIHLIQLHPVAVLVLWASVVASLHKEGKRGKIADVGKVYRGHRRASQGDTLELQKVPNYQEICLLHQKEPDQEHTILSAYTSKIPWFWKACYNSAKKVTVISIQKYWQTKYIHYQMNPTTLDCNGSIR